MSGASFAPPAPHSRNRGVASSAARLQTSSSARARLEDLRVELLEPGLGEARGALLVWVREVGALIWAAGVTTFLVRKAPDSVALRGVLIGNAVLHLGLLPIELVAFSTGVITQASGVAPNSMIHVLLAAGFVTYAFRMRGLEADVIFRVEPLEARTFK